MDRTQFLWDAISVIESIKWPGKIHLNVARMRIIFMPDKKSSVKINLTQLNVS